MKDPRITITLPMRLLEERLKTLTFFFNMIVPLIQKNVQVVAQLLIIDVWNQEIQKITTFLLQEMMLKIF